MSPAPRILSTLLLLLLFACENQTPTPETTAVETSPLTFTNYTLSDSVALRDGGPLYRYTVNTLRAEGGDPTLRDSLNRAVEQEVFHHALPADSTLEQAFAAEASRLFTAYRGQEIDEKLLNEFPQSYARELQWRTEVLRQSDSLIVLTNLVYEYQGGAHGMSSTELLTFATGPVRRIRYNDIFRVGSERQVQQLLTRRAIQDDLKDQVFSDSITVTQNVAPLPDGVRFLYTPYEIGPYSSGAIEIDLPYDSLTDVLRDDFKR